VGYVKFPGRKNIFGYSDAEDAALQSKSLTDEVDLDARLAGEIAEQDAADKQGSDMKNALFRDEARKAGKFVPPENTEFVFPEPTNRPKYLPQIPGYVWDDFEQMQRLAESVVEKYGNQVRYLGKIDKGIDRLEHTGSELKKLEVKMRKVIAGSVEVGEVVGRDADTKRGDEAKAIEDAEKDERAKHDLGNISKGTSADSTEADGKKGASFLSVSNTGTESVLLKSERIGGPEVYMKKPSTCFSASVLTLSDSKTPLMSSPDPYECTGRPNFSSFLLSFNDDLIDTMRFKAH